MHCALAEAGGDCWRSAWGLVATGGEEGRANWASLALEPGWMTSIHSMR